MQEHFPGVGNWMADEILWRARLHPSTPAGSLDRNADPRPLGTVRWVSRTAIRIISDDWTYPPTWLFAHRWEAGGTVPALPHGPPARHRRRPDHLLVPGMPAGTGWRKPVTL